MERWHEILGARGVLQVDVPEAGLLDFRVAERDLVFMADTGKSIHFPEHPLLDSPAAVVAKPLMSGLLIALEWGRAVYWADAAALDLTAVVELGRADEDDSAFMFLRFIDAPDAVVAIYENGAACFEPNGRLRWHCVHQDYGRRAVRIENGYLLYRDQEGVSWSYRLTDGREDRVQ